VQLGMSNSEADGHLSLLLVVGIIICLSELLASFLCCGFSVNAQWNLFADETDMLQSLEALWVDFVCPWVLVCFGCHCQFRQSLADS